MQINTSGRDKESILRDILRAIAIDPDPHKSVLPILHSIRTLTAANNAAFFFFHEPEIRIVDGEQQELIPANQSLAALAGSLSAGLHINPAIPTAAADGLKTWVAAPIRIQRMVVGIVWLSFSAPFELNEEDRELLEIAVDGLTIVALNAQSQERHEGARQLMTSLLNSIMDPILVLDEQRRLLLMNRAAEDLFAIKSVDAAGKTLDEIIQAEDLLGFAEGQVEKMDEWSTSDQKRTFVPRIEIARDTAGNTEGWVLALRDVTRFKRLNRNQSEFTRIVSHDLRSPLTSMQGFASMLEMVGELNEKQKHFVDKILSGITQMASLVDNIQDAGRYDPETGFYEMQRAQVDLSEMAKRIVDNHLLPAEKQELTLAVAIDPNVPIVNVDSNMLERAITNLVDNAIKYTPNGGTIRVGVERKTDQLVISIQDDGYGISPEHQKMLFERHVRIQRQEHKRVKGSGLGLFIVRSVAMRHGGDAWVESAPGSGSTFFIAIPLSGANLVGGASNS